MGPYLETTESAAPSLLVLSPASSLVRITLCGVNSPCDGLMAFHESDLGSPLRAIRSTGSARGDGHKRFASRSVPTHHNVQHHLLLEKVARRVQDDGVMRLLKMILKVTGKKGVPQGGVVSPLLSNLYLNEVDRMLEKAIQTTRREPYTHVHYARFAHDMVILVDSHPRHDWLARAVEQRLREELAKLKVKINEEKSKIVDLAKGGSFTFLGFEYSRILGRNKKWRPHYAPN